MILFELTGTENNAVYQKLAIANGNRQYDFLKSIAESSLEIGRPFLSQHVIKALNFQAITCLHTNAGEYRPCPVQVGDYQPPDHYRVGALMDDFVNTVNRNWEVSDPVVLASFVLWRLNHIHPFINGNGRTARAACYFVLCLKLGALLPGERILPELLTENRERYVAALRAVDASLPDLDLGPLHALLSELLDQQVAATVEAAEAEGNAQQVPEQPEDQA
ncbi:cell filamentation protein Fic [Rhizobium anhuiense]|uniref:Fic family protein n=1 Tax=Rhizobium anhuiense TaxID=1184720 RepID=UPI001442641B|nr:cell filamentation protein Fic [Rhizobium anhuiense]